MIITAEYTPDRECSERLQQTLKKAQRNISRTQIDERKGKLIENRPLWSEVQLSFSFNKNPGNVKLDLFQYVEDPNSQTIKELLAIFIDIIAFYELTIEGKLMPLYSDFNNTFELDITHSKGNAIFKIVFNEMSYIKFLVIIKLMKFIIR